MSASLCSDHGRFPIWVQPTGHQTRQNRSLDGQPRIISHWQMIQSPRTPICPVIKRVALSQGHAPRPAMYSLQTSALNHLRQRNDMGCNEIHCCHNVGKRCDWEWMEVSFLTGLLKPHPKCLEMSSGAAAQSRKT
jgi:hypothetical protein